jgi:hypothetical protein
MPAKRKVRITRQSVMLALRFVLLVLAVAANIYAYAQHLELFLRVILIVVSLLAFPLFHLLVAIWWEPMRMRAIARKGGETFIIPPHYCWNIHRESRSDYSNIPGTISLSDRFLRFVSSPLYLNDDLDHSIPLHQITGVSTILPERKWGTYLVVSLRDGAKMKIRLLSPQQQTRWALELQSKITVKA